MEWLEDNKIPPGKWVEAGVDWLIVNLAWFFDGLSAGLEAIIDGLLWVLQAPHAFVVIAVITGVSWFARRSFGFTLYFFADAASRYSRSSACRKSGHLSVVSALGEALLISTHLGSIAASRSASTAARPGRVEQPIAVRAWRPISAPKTSMASQTRR